MENLKVIRTSKQESLTREVELFKDEKQLAQNYINSEGFIFEEADLIPTNLKLDIDSNYTNIPPNEDKWKNWVFQSAGEVNFENETSRNESNVRIELDADKVTDKINNK